MRKDMLTQLSIDVLNNSALSWSAKGLYFFMAHGHLPEDEVSREKLIQSSRTGKFSTTSALKELINLGVVKKVVRRKEDKRYDGFYYRAV